MLPYIATPTRLLSADDKGLVRWRPPSDATLATCREIWMPAKLMDKINAPNWDPVGREDGSAAKQRRRDCITLMTSFLLGDDISVGSSNDRVDFKAMTPDQGKPWQAWELRPIYSRRKTRLFGVLASDRDFLAWECVPKDGMSPAQQTNLARTAINRSVAILGQGVLSFSQRPTAKSLGGEQLGWVDL